MTRKWRWRLYKLNPCPYKRSSTDIPRPFYSEVTAKNLWTRKQALTRYPICWYLGYEKQMSAVYKSPSLWDFVIAKLHLIVIFFPLTDLLHSDLWKFEDRTQKLVLKSHDPLETFPAFIVFYVFYSTGQTPNKCVAWHIQWTMCSMKGILSLHCWILAWCPPTHSTCSVSMCWMITKLQVSQNFKITFFVLLF